MREKQGGFTLVEIAIVLVIIGLLLGGVLKGQELISSARVRNLADQQSGLQAAYYGFQDRYRAVPGDMGDATDAADAIGVSTINCAGDSDGQLEDPDDGWKESNGAWEQLSKAGFIKGSYDAHDDHCGAKPESGNTDQSPLNVYSSPVVIAFVRKGKFLQGSAQHLALFLGRNVPVDIARELDIKIDDGKPATGTLRNAKQEDGGDQPYKTGEGCTDGSDSDQEWDVKSNAQDCNPVYLF